MSAINQEPNDHASNEITNEAIIHSLKIGENLTEVFYTISNSFSVEATAIAISGFLSTDEKGNHLIYISNAINALISCLDRRRRQGQSDEPIVFTSEEKQALKLMFRTLESCLPIIRRSDYATLQEEFILSIQQLIESHPEVIQFAESLVNSAGKRPTEQLISTISDIAPQKYQIQEIVETDQTRQTLDTLGRYQTIQKLFDTLNNKQKDMIIRSISAVPNIQDTLKVVEIIFSSRETDYLAHNLHYTVSMSELAKVLNNDLIFTLLDILAENTKEFRFQLGIILSQLKLKDIPDSIAKKLNPTLLDLEMSILPENNGWYLCGNSESLLFESMKNKATVLVNKKILVKLDGICTGLCLETFTTKNGYTFLAGNWYSPDKKTQQRIKDAKETTRATTDQGLATTLVEDGTWTIMRSAIPFNGMLPEEIIYRARKYVMKSEQQLP